MTMNLTEPLITPSNSKLRTFPSKKLFDPINPKLGDITVEDVARALSHICRFGGWIPVFYSIAQHAVFVSEICHPYEYEGLHHDDPEGMGIMDMPRPVKHHSSMLGYRQNEQVLIEFSHKMLGITDPFHEAIKRADDQMLVCEMENFAPESAVYYKAQLYEKGIIPIYKKIRPWSPDEAMERYLARHYELVRQRNKREIDESDRNPGVIA